MRELAAADAAVMRALEHGWPVGAVHSGRDVVVGDVLVPRHRRQLALITREAGVGHYVLVMPTCCSNAVNILQCHTKP